MKINLLRFYIYEEFVGTLNELVNNGWKIVPNSFRVGPKGELYILVMKDGEDIS